jgi:hypothetical protein
MIPLATTTVSVWRLPADDTRDGFDTPSVRQQVATGLRAHIGSPSTRTDISAGDKVVTDWRLDTDPFDFADDDQLVDENTGETYRLLGAVRRSGFGLDHCEGRVRQISGAS